MRSLRVAPWLFFATAVAWASTAKATEADNAVSQLLAQANERVASGESPADVEAWLGAQLKPFKGTSRPPDWDVYGAARWRTLEGDPGPVLGTPAPATR